MGEVRTDGLKSPSGRCYPKQSRLYTYQGKTLSLKGWARELGICHSSLLKRIARFGDGEESLPYVFANRRYPPSGGRKKELEYNGRKTSFKELSQRYGISEQRLRDRVRAGWNVDRALTTSSFEARSHASKNRMKKVMEKNPFIKDKGALPMIAAHRGGVGATYLYFPSATIEMVGYLCMTLIASFLLRWWEKKLDGNDSYSLATGDQLAPTSGMLNHPGKGSNFDERNLEYPEGGEQ